MCARRGLDLVTDTHRIRHEISHLGVRLEQEGLLSGTAGNLSARAGDVVAITPSAIPYGEVTPDDVVVVDLDGAVVEGHRRPSSELWLHLGVYHARPDVGAVVHTHSPFATVLAVLHWPLPAAHYAIAALETYEVPVVDYATYGTSELAGNVRSALPDGTCAVLLANHGAVTFGADLRGAADRTRLLESLAHTYYHARLAGDPVILTEEEMAVVRERFRAHGQGDR
jgi:L-fuculose-phosphate aldolase